MLTGKQKHYLRGLGHHLLPIVQVGKEGPSGGLISALDDALLEHELIKVRLGEAVALERHALAEALAEATLAELVQVIGRTLLLYRRRAEEPAIVLPGEKTTGGSAEKPKRQRPRKRS